MFFILFWWHYFLFLFSVAFHEDVLFSQYFSGGFYFIPKTVYLKWIIGLLLFPHHIS